MNNMKKQIFIISPTESCLTHRGDRHPKLAVKFQEAQWSVCYISTDFYHAEKRYFTQEEINSGRKAIDYELKLFHIPAYKDNISASRLLGYILLAIKSFFFLLPRVRRKDVLLVPCRPAEILLVGRLLKLFCRVHLVMDVRDVWPDGLPLKKILHHQLFASYCKMLNYCSAPGADLIFYTANGFLPWIRKYSSRESYFIPLGYDENRWKNAQVLSEKDFEDNVIRLVFVGDLAKSMQIHDLVSAIASNPHYHLTFIGGGERLDETKNLVQHLHAENITFCGRMTKEEVTKAMQQQHISIIPLKVKFSMPNKLFDALGAKRPILVYGKNDAADFAVQEKIGWQLDFDAGQEKEFFQQLSIHDIIAASNQIDQIRQQYSKESLYQKMSKSIQKIIINDSGDNKL